MKTMIKIKTIGIVLATMLIMTACMDSEKNKLDARAADYWKYKVNHEYKKAYEFLSPGWRKTDSIVAYEQKMITSKVKWLGAAVSKKECSQPDLCVVTMAITYEYQFKATDSNKVKVESTVKETWLLKGNVWYHLPLHKKMSQK